ncbi:cyclohex-1-ene-1-carboxylate:CoA ligase [Mycobacterium sp. E3251]|uniref:class I adenylate-forming enzyme family protein n=1 Tax=unclassified Mycobacterium TaxID=2642494 RepID=UPI0007FFEB50|nr:MULTISPECIES: AMP-binding protein [unclassified Mycobacterium]OBG90487.1 cyclohex-1-ene-1-carboxylate:CoA ligase [Mycobacterium sp. E3251]OBI38178.1 cyclohex-1-ene-1-carboxylate:CoA ligase [Mycobacterium sp. E1386]
MTGDTIAGLLDECASARPNQPLLREESGATLTVADVASLSAAGTRWLARAGVRPEMTVAWQLPSYTYAAVLMLALARTQVTQAPVLHLYRQREVRAAHDVANADILVVDGTTAANAPPDVPVVRLPDDFLNVLRDMPEGLDPMLVGTRSADDARWIYFTSGSTGRPKGVTHTDTTLLASARGFAAHLGLGEHENEIGTIAFPIAHVGGILYVAAGLIGAFSALMLPKVDAAQLPGILAAHRVTVSGSSTAFYQMLLSEQLASGSDEPLIPSLRMLIGGGAPCPPELHRKVRRHMGVPILHAYGMTEAPMICVSEATDTEEQQSNTSGRPIPGADIRIGGTGEIELRGANVTPGYIDAEQWSRAVTPDGWFRTGDRGHLRPDGRVVITGRIKDLIIRKGENISPDEIENELLAHPLIDAVAVVGQPDELRGEAVCAVVRRSPGQPDLTLDQLCAFLDQRGLMKQKWPERLVIVDEFPLTGLGKIAKSELAQQIAGGSR